MSSLSSTSFFFSCLTSDSNLVTTSWASLSFSCPVETITSWSNSSIRCTDSWSSDRTVSASSRTVSEDRYTYTHTHRDTLKTVILCGEIHKTNRICLYNVVLFLECYKYLPWVCLRLFSCLSVLSLCPGVSDGSQIEQCPALSNSTTMIKD